MSHGFTGTKFLGFSFGDLFCIVSYTGPQGKSKPNLFSVTNSKRCCAYGRLKSVQFFPGGHKTLAQNEIAGHEQRFRL